MIAANYFSDALERAIIGRMLSNVISENESNNNLKIKASMFATSMGEVFTAIQSGMTIESIFTKFFEKGINIYETIENDTHASPMHNMCADLTRRYNIRKASACLHRAFSDPDSLDLSEVAEKIIQYSTSKSDFKEYSQRDLVNHTMKILDTKTPQKKYTLGIPIIEDLVKVKSGNMVYIVAPPKVGKTWLEASIAHNLSKNSKVFFISAEMHPHELHLRIMSKIAQLDLSEIGYGVVRERTASAYSNAIPDAIELNLNTVNARGIHFADLKNLMLSAVNRGYEIIIIDYLQRVVHGGETERIGTMRMSRELTNLTAKHNVLTICASQAGRAARKEDFTQAHHAKESGAIEEDADIILSLTNTTDFSAVKNVDELEYELAIDIVQRNGYCGMVHLMFDPKTGTYRSKPNVI